MVGQTISHYKITEKLGEGGMGVVYKATDTELNRPVALKFLAPHLLRDEEGRKRFRREAQAAAALDHPNICTVYEIGQAEDQSFIAMAYLEGRTLSKRIADGPLKLPEALSIAFQMAEGLEAAHEKGVVHRDIKPDNVMLMKGSRGLVKLMDFGLAQLAHGSKLTREGTTLGTPIYMSPEQALGESTDKRADVWALGVVLYEMVVGRPPFRGEVDQAVIYSIANEEHEPLTAVRTGVPKELERVVDKCLAKDADERYQHVTDLLVDLQACRRSLGAQPAGPTPSPAPTNRTSLLVGVAALVAACLGLAWWLTRSSGPAPVPQYNLRQITRDTGYTADPALSPDGKLLAYSSDRDGDGVLDIWVQQLTGGATPINITQHADHDYQPSFSPDGSRIVFHSDRDGGGSYVIPALGGNPGLIAGTGFRLGNTGAGGRFSPNGEWISYTQWSPGPEAEVLSQIELVPASGGSPRVLETGMFFARTPIWSPNSEHVLFAGYKGTAGSGERAKDWWLVAATGGEAVRLGAREIFAKQGIIMGARAFLQFPTPKAWLPDGNRVIFSGAIAGSTTNIWQVRISAGDGRLLGEPQRLTSGTGEEDPSVSHDGRIAFVSRSADVDIWNLPLDTNRAEPLGEPQRVVGGLSEDGSPSVSADGRKLVYVSERTGNGDVWLRDLETGQETPQTTSPEREGRAMISPDGSMVAFVRVEGRSGNLYVVNLNQRPRMLAEGVNILGWLPDSKRILGYTQPAPSVYKIVDTETEAQVDLELKHPERATSVVRFSPDSKWIAFNSNLKPDEFPLFISRIEQGQPTAHDEWIQVTEGGIDSHPSWSPDGNTIYYLSTRDGFVCLWAQALDAKTKRPQGSPKEIWPFHGAQSPYRESKGLFPRHNQRPSLFPCERTQGQYLAG